MEINFNPAIKLNSHEDNYIKSQMASLGLKPTGSKEGDIKAIQTALAQKDCSDENKISGECKNAPPPKTPEAVATFMEKLGLTPTNTKEGDNTLITAKLSELEVSAKTDAEKSNVQGLQAEFQGIIAQAGIAGQEMTSMMNKSFFNLKS